MSIEPGGFRKGLEKIKQEINSKQNQYDAKCLFLSAIVMQLVRAFIPEKAIGGQVIEQIMDVVTIGLITGGFLKLAGVNITDTALKAVSHIKRIK